MKNILIIRGPLPFVISVFAIVWTLLWLMSNVTLNHVPAYKSATIHFQTEGTDGLENHVLGIQPLPMKDGSIGVNASLDGEVLPDEWAMPVSELEIPGYWFIRNQDRITVVGFGPWTGVNVWDN